MRFGIPFEGPVISFRARVEYHRISAADLSRTTSIWPNSPAKYIPWICVARGVWKGDILVADIEELEKMDTSEIHATKPKAKEVLTPMNGDNLKFPIADGTVSASENTHLDPGSS